MLQTLWLVTCLCTAPTPTHVFTGDPAHVSLRYNVVHKLHKVDATSTAVEARAALLPDGKLQVMVRTAVAGFKSGDGNRDEHMLETTEGQKFPYVTYKGVGHLDVPTSFPARASLTLAGELEFHGEKHPESFPITVEFTSAREARVTGPITVSLDKYKIERPSLLFVKIEDACVIDVDIVVHEPAS